MLAINKDSVKAVINKAGMATLFLPFKDESTGIYPLAACLVDDAA